MNHNEIRQQFIDFFVNKNHLAIPSDSLIPRGDKTLLFTNAGMNQFKDIFLNYRQPKHFRIVNSQKCMRVSGKHNDLDDVGRDTSHHTLFEMLGNWSFGDYYKTEAISFAWELLTVIWGLPKDKLWATYYHDDEESHQIWQDTTDIKKNQILPFGDKDNFWEMGEIGPCGPCSEIHIDLGEKYCTGKNDPAHNCGVNSGCARYIELWNLVFIQFNKDINGKLTQLPKKHVDTGMGFERLVSVLQGTYSNYDTDLFIPLIDHITSLSGIQYHVNNEHDIAIRVISDHLRALTFLISDGIFPSNEGRGYVLRRILRRGVRHGMMLGLEKPFLHELVNTCVDIMGSAYPELKNNPKQTTAIIKKEEERFHKTLSRGIHVLEDLIERGKKEERRTFSGKEMFLLYDTYGFPPDLTKDLLDEKGIALDENGFEEAMTMQKEKGRSGWDGSKQQENEQIETLYRKFPVTNFSGYDKEYEKTQILTLFKNKNIVQLLNEGESGECLLEKTPFYGESGGQVGDTGIISNENLLCHINDTKKMPTGHIIHYLTVIKGKLSIKDEITAEIDTERRNNIKRNHTSTHILQAVLREIIGDHVHQAGSLVASSHFRFDFTHFERISHTDLIKIEDEVNRIILSNFEVTTEITDFNDAVNQGAMALFDEKYGNQVRMIRIPGISLELCGGTHVLRTGDIGMFKLLHEGGVAAGVRRIEAITGKSVLNLLRSLDDNEKFLIKMLKTSKDNLSEKINNIFIQNKEKDKEIHTLKKLILKNEFINLSQSIKIISGYNVIAAQVKYLDTNDLRTLADSLKVNMKQGIVILMTNRNGKALIVASVTKDLINKIHAGKLVGKLAKIVSGGGGGRPDFAQAGGKDPSKIPDALAKIHQFIS